MWIVLTIFSVERLACIAEEWCSLSRPFVDKKYWNLFTVAVGFKKYPKVEIGTGDKTHVPNLFI